jgi:hypothetical protein
LFGAAALATEPLQPFTATYAVEWRGMSAGISTLELKRESDDRYVYSSRNVARGIFRLALPGAITQSSEFTLGPDGVRPLQYRADDGSKDTRRDVQLEFDWSAGRVRGIAEDAAVDVPLEAGTQDALSVQIQLMRELAAGRSPSTFALIDSDEVKRYEYLKEGTASIDTALGQLDTIVYLSRREGSSRENRYWLAPSLGYLPVRAEQMRRGRKEFVMTVRSIAR